MEYSINFFAIFNAILLKRSLKPLASCKEDDGRCIDSKTLCPNQLKLRCISLWPTLQQQVESWVAGGFDGISKCGNYRRTFIASIWLERGHLWTFTSEGRWLWLSMAQTNHDKHWFGAYDASEHSCNGLKMPNLKSRPWLQKTYPPYLVFEAQTRISVGEVKNMGQWRPHGSSHLSCNFTFATWTFSRIVHTLVLNDLQCRAPENWPH